MTQNKQAAFVLIHDGINALMVARAKDGLFGFPGGKVEPNESLLDAAVRECREEIGVDLSNQTLTYIGQHMVQSGTGTGTTATIFELDLSKSTDAQSLEDMVLHYTNVHCSPDVSVEIDGVQLFGIDSTEFTKMPLAPTVLEELQQVFGTRIQ